MNSKNWFPLLIGLLLFFCAEKIFGELQVHNISMQPTVYNFTEHAYNMERIGEGVRLSFIVPHNDSIAIIIDNTSEYPNASKYLEFYGTDLTFTTSLGGKDGSSTIIFPQKLTAGKQYYCMVKPKGTRIYDNDFSVHIGLKSTLTVVAEGNGNVSGSSSNWTHLPLPIRAFEAPTSYFDNWTVSEGGSVENLSKDSTSIVLTMTSVTATANFLPRKIHDITFEADTFNFLAHGGNARNGVLFKFSPSRADSFYITVSGVSAASNLGSVITFYNDDQTFSFPDSQTTKNQFFEFRAEANKDLYFRIKPADETFEGESFTVEADSFYTLTVLPDSIFTVTGTGTFPTMKKGDCKNIKITGYDKNYLYSFDKWDIVSGNAQLDTTNRLVSTTVCIDSSDAVIKAHVRKKDIYTISNIVTDTFQYSVHGNFASAGVLLCYDAVSADSFLLDLQKLTSHRNLIVYYGQDSTFTSYINYYRTTGLSNSISFRSSAANQKHYFRIYPDYQSNDAFQFTALIKNYYMLIVQTEMNGEVNNYDTIVTPSGLNNKLPPFPQYSGRYFFKNWSVVEGTATLSDSMDSVSTISIDTHTTVKAVFGERSLIKIAETWDTVAFNADTITGGTKGGILYSFTAPATDSFCVYFIPRTYFYFWDYGVDLAKSTIPTYSNPTEKKLYFNADSGETYYYRIAPRYPRDSTQLTAVRYYQFHNLTIKKEVAGVFSSDSISKNVGSNGPIAIDTFSSTSLRYYFSHWEIVSGIAEITDSYQSKTSIYLHSDVVIKAVYLERPVQQLGFDLDTLNYKDIQGGTDGGVLFSFTSEVQDSFVLCVNNIEGAYNKNLIYYGTDPTCSSEIRSVNGNNGLINFTFNIGQPGETVYFMVTPTNKADTVKSFNLRLFRLCKVFIKAENGEVSPLDTVTVQENGKITIETRPNPYSYYFKNWEIVSGSAVIGDVNNSITSLTVDSVDVVLEAKYEPKTLYTITDSITTYLFGAPPKGFGGSNYSGGVIMKFIAPYADTFAVCINATQEHLRCIYYYGMDNSFVTAIDSAEGLHKANLFFEAKEAGEEHYFRIAPKNRADDNPVVGYTVCYRSTSNINFLVDTGGIVKPAGVAYVANDDNVGISAVAQPKSPLYYFDKWVLESGEIKYTAGSEPTHPNICVLPVDGNASIRAKFIKKEIHKVTNKDTTFTFNIHGFPSGGVPFYYTPTRTDTHAIVITLPSSYWYVVNTYNTNSNLDSVCTKWESDHSAYLKLIFDSVSKNYYFNILPYYGDGGSDYKKSFTIRVDTTVQLRISCDSTAETNLTETMRFLKGGKVSVTAKPKINFRDKFKVWRILSGKGNVTISDSTSQTITVTANEDAHIHAVFEQKPVHVIGFTNDTICYATEGAPSKSGGILMKYVASAADSFVLKISNGDAISRNLKFYHYGTDKTFRTTVKELPNRSSATFEYTFKTEAPGDVHYFRVEPYDPHHWDSQAYYNDSIAVRVLGYSTIEIRTDGRGTTVPADSIRILQTKPYNVQAVPLSKFYQFWKWTALSDNVVIDSINSSSTTIAITDNGKGKIQASFDSYSINTIPKMPSKATYTYDSEVPSGVFLKFKSENADSFLLHVKHTNSSIVKKLTYYGINDKFADSSIVQEYSCQNMNDTVFRFKALAANVDHYFCITPFGGYDDNFDIMWIPFSYLTVSCDYGGKVTPVKPVFKSAGDTVNITAEPTNTLFTFNRWEILSGNPEINEHYSKETWVRLGENGDAVIRAKYDIKPHDTLFIDDDSNGIAVPLNMALVDTSKDTVVTAHANSYWVFDKWEIVNGNPQIANVNAKTTRVKLNGNARIKAKFIPDPAAEPSLVINSISSQNQPEIEMIATLRDHFGNVISANDSVKFKLMQDITTPEITAQRISDVRGISVSLVIDRSASMTENSRIDSAVVAAKTFIDEMDLSDRASIVTFSTGTDVEQSMTNDKNLLKNALDQIVPFGETAIIDGAYRAIEELINETNTKSIILFSDGYEVGSNRTLKSVINLAQKNNITIYSIAVGPEAFFSVDSTLRPLADSTNGYFFFARSASELTDLYKRIKKDIESQYLIEYVSPDNVIDGDTHTVYLSTEILGMPLRDSTEWVEATTGLVIKLTNTTKKLIENTQLSETELPIDLWIIADEHPVPTRKIFYRTMGNDVFNEAVLEYRGDSTYGFIIVPDYVAKPGIEFRVTAADDNGNNAEKGPYRININNDGPVIVHSSPTRHYLYNKLEIEAVVYDPDTISSVKIYYKNNSEQDFNCETMEYTADDTYKVSIDGKKIFGNYLEYYIEAEDNFLAMSRNPSFDNYKIDLIINQPPKIIFSGNTVYTEEETVKIKIMATDPEGEVVNLRLVSSLPEGAIYDSVEQSIGTFRWITGLQSSGEYLLVFNVSDNNNSVTDSVKIKIIDKRFQPMVLIPERLNVTEGDTVTFIISAYDPVGEGVTITAASMPVVAARFNSLPSVGDTSKAQLFWATGMFDQGTYKFLFTSTNETRSVTDTVTIVVVDKSFYSPVLHASATDTIIARDKELRISIWATDEDQTRPSLQLLDMPDNASFDKNVEGDSGIFIWMPSLQNKVDLKAIAFDKIDVNQVCTLDIHITVAQFDASASFLDTNGNGFMDRIAFIWQGDAVLKETLPQPGEWVDSIGIYFNGDYLALDPVKMVRVDSVNAYFVLSERNDIVHTGYDSVKIKLKSYVITKKQLPTVITSISDLAGPIIKRAVYYPGLKDVNEEKKIVVYFSEPVLWPQVKTHPNDFLRYYKNGNLVTQAFSSSCVVKSTSPDSAVIVLDYDMQISSASDSLSLLPVASDMRTHITDGTESKNLPYKDNRRVSMILANKLVNIFATVCDTNGEGHIDLIVLTIEPDYSLPANISNVKNAISSIYVKPKKTNTERKLQPTTIVKGQTPKQIKVIISENRTQGFETAWDDFSIVFDSSFVSGEGMQFQLRQVHDSVGPVISRATVFPAGLESQGNYDTLRVEFSEPIQWINKTPVVNNLFNFFTESNTGRSLVPFDGLSSLAILYCDSVNISIKMDNGYTFSPNTDSLNIRFNGVNGEIQDVSNIWPHVNNRKVQIDYQKNVQFKVTICPNPYTPIAARNNGLGKPGMAIIVECDTIASMYSGKITIFDALGNVVVKDRKMQEGVHNNLWLTYLWDANDDKGYGVGRGVYFARIIVKDKKGGKERKYAEKLGVMRAAN